MQSKRDYLVGLGLAKPGRGKFSNAAKEALVKAEAEGMRFSDAAPTAKVVKADSTEQVEVKSNPGDSLYLYPADFRFPEEEYVAVAHLDGKRKEYSMRECCNGCRVSLTNHACNSPSILGNMAVKIERR